MTRAKLIQAVVAQLKALPKNAHIEAEWRAGLQRRMLSDGTIDFSDNGSRTLTIRVNGGAHDTEAEPEYMESFRRSLRGRPRRRAKRR